MESVLEMRVEHLMENNEGEDKNKDFPPVHPGKKSKPSEENFQLFKRIIIVDDELKIRLLFSNVLSKEGYETMTFGDNAQAIQYLKDNAQLVDLLLLDLDMPHIDGRYFCAMMRIKNPSVKIVIASNYGIDVQKYLILDADDYFDKSEGIQALKKKVKQVLSDRR